MSRLLFVALGVAVAAVALGSLARQGVFPEAREVQAVAAVPETTITVLWCHEVLNPSRIRVPKDHLVTLVVETSAAESPGALAIPGYGSVLEPITIEPGEKRSATFVTSLPGEGFEIYVGEENAGRFDVTGDHVTGDRL